MIDRHKAGNLACQLCRELLLELGVTNYDECREGLLVVIEAAAGSIGMNCGTDAALQSLAEAMGYVGKLTGAEVQIDFLGAGACSTLKH